MFIYTLHVLSCAVLYGIVWQGMAWHGVVCMYILYKKRKKNIYIYTHTLYIYIHIYIHRDVYIVKNTCFCGLTCSGRASVSSKAIVPLAPGG